MNRSSSTSTDATALPSRKMLLDSLETLTEAEYEELWIEEGEARYADFQAGKTSAVDGDEVFARARSRKR